MYEVIIVGGGIAGLSAALILGRCRRRVLLCDSDRPRNGASAALHGFLSQDGINPWEIRRLGREQLNNYPSIEFRPLEVIDACHRPEGGFIVRLASGESFSCRKLLLATGIVDHLPSIAGMEEFYGHGVFHCPYCDGWENRDAPLAVYARGEEGAAFALEIRNWGADVILCTDGEDMPEEPAKQLSAWGIGIEREQLLRLEGEAGRLAGLVFASGKVLPRKGLFFLPEQVPQSALALRLGCRRADQATIATGRLQETEVPGLYLAGDAARSIKLAIIAAAEGAEAAFAIHSSLQKEDFP